jgi:hypothetical protein
MKVLTDDATEFNAWSDIILDYVKSPVEGEYTTPNTKKRIRSSTSTPVSTDKQQSKIPKHRYYIRHE